MSADTAAFLWTGGGVALLVLLVGALAPVREPFASREEQVHCYIQAGCILFLLFGALPALL